MASFARFLPEFLRYLRSYIAVEYGRAGKVCSSRCHVLAWLCGPGLVQGLSLAVDDEEEEACEEDSVGRLLQREQYPRPHKPGWHSPTRPSHSRRPEGRCSWGWRAVPEDRHTIIHCWLFLRKCNYHLCFLILASYRRWLRLMTKCCIADGGLQRKNM